MVRERRAKRAMSGQFEMHDPRERNPVSRLMTGDVETRGKQPKVESVIRITRNREPRVLENSPLPPVSPSTKTEIPTPQIEVKTQRQVKAHYKNNILTITGIPFDRRIRDEESVDDDSATINPSTKRKLDDNQRTPRKRNRVDWAARNARSPRRSQRNLQQDTISFEQDVQNHDVPIGAHHQIPSQADEPKTNLSPEIQPRMEESSPPSTKQINFAFTVPGVVADPFKSPATDVTDFYFDAVAEQSGVRSPEVSRKIASGILGEQVPELIAAASPVEGAGESLEQSIEKDVCHTNQQGFDSDHGPAPTHSPQDRNSSSISSLSSKAVTPSPLSDILEPPKVLTTFALEDPPALSNTTSNTLNLAPFQSMARSPPSRSTFPDNEAYILATKFRPLMPLQNFITALTSQDLSGRLTEDLYELARSTQTALEAWQDEYILLDKKTAPVAGPFPKKPATGGRLPIDSLKWEAEKEKELFGEGSLLSGLAKRRGRTAGIATKIVTDHAATHEGRELRKRRGEASFIEGLGISEDDAGAMTEGKRSRRPVRRFEVGQNGEGKRGVRRRRGAGGLLATAIGATSHADIIARNGYDSDAVQTGIESDVPAAASSTPIPRKRGRLSTLQNSFSNSNAHDANDSNDTSPSPTSDPADGEFSDAHAPIRRRAAATTTTSMGSKQVHYSTTASPALLMATAIPALMGEQQPRKQRKKSEKRSESMTAWWAERKRKAAADKAAFLASRVATAGKGDSVASKSGLDQAVVGEANQVFREGREKRGGAVARMAMLNGDDAGVGSTNLPTSSNNNNNNIITTEAQHNRPEDKGKRQQKSGPQDGKGRVFGPAGLDARGGIMESWALDESSMMRADGIVPPAMAGGGDGGGPSSAPIGRQSTTGMGANTARTRGRANGMAI